MTDQIMTLADGSTIQYGPLNDRIYLMKTGGKCSDRLASNLIDLAKKHNFSKIFAKVMALHADQFLTAGYGVEAEVPGFYNGSETCYFLAYYLNHERAYESESGEYDRIMQHALAKKGMGVSSIDSSIFTLRSCTEQDIERIAGVYNTVFESYPFPIHDPDYLLKTMRSHVDYFCVEAGNAIISVSSAEMDEGTSNVEMTDFATLPEWRGHGFAVHLLGVMEREMRGKGIKTAYTIARAASPGMNITVAKNNYSYGGRLKNNTNISGNIESMNVWYKKLSR